MANIPGLTTALPSVISDVTTNTRGASVPGGLRVAAIIGEGSTNETLISTAVGGGVDGLDSTYSSTTGADGRHFKLSNAPLISKRTSIYKNGVRLTGIEATIDSNSFSTRYDYRLDPETGKLEMQKAYIVDQGGVDYRTLTTNTGLGTIEDLVLEDLNALKETWTIRCVSVQRDNSNDPIQETAKFIAIGSISGPKLDANGNPILWTSDGTVVSNGVLEFSINETQSASISTSPFIEGDAFTIKIDSGVLNVNDSLTANYIPESFINDPETLQGLGQVVAKHGLPSTSNTLSLGAQLLFANGASSVIAVQAAPSVPRRVSYDLTDKVNSLSTNNEEFIFALPAGITPDSNASIHFFVTNNTTGVETQLLPNKYEFYTLGESGHPSLTTFITDNTSAPSGYSFSYTVIERDSAELTGLDGYLARDSAFTNKGVFSASETFLASAVGKTLRITDATNVANNGDFDITDVSDGALYLELASFSNFTTESSVVFELQGTDGYSYANDSDGTLTDLSGGTASFTSSSVDFSTFSGLTSKRIYISGSDYNNGLYDITAYDSFTNTLTIEKALVSETSLRYELIDTSNTSNYIVVNKNVVPNNNALRVTLIDTDDATFFDSGWVSALASLEKFECDIVVPLPIQTPSVIFQNTLTHCKVMSNIRNKKERVLFTGAIAGLTPENLTGAEDAAVEDIGVLEGIQGDSVTEVLNGNIEDLANYSVSDAFGNTYRCVYFAPDQIVVSLSGSNTLVDGFYLGAAAAGYEVADLRLENPLTNKTLTGFSILRDKVYTTTQLEQLAQAGVTTLQPVQGGGNVIWGKTTTQSGYPEEEEISIIFIRDRLAKVMRAAFKGFIGTPQTPDTLTLMTTRAVQVLNSFVSQGLITEYADLSVAYDAVDPRQVNVSVRVAPTYGINWVFVRIGVGTI